MRSSDSTTTTQIRTPSSDSQSGSQKMKFVYFSNEFPHDDLQDLYRRFHTHSKDRGHPVLARFLDEATVTIRDEIRKLPAALQGLIPPFETILDFADHPELRKGHLSGSVEGILLCVVELATLIRYVMPTHSAVKYVFSCLLPVIMRSVPTTMISIL